MTKQPGWLERRRERARREKERTGDTPEKQAEATREPTGENVEDSAQRASTGLLANGGSFQG